MDPNLFLNSLQELYLSFFPEPVDKTRNVIYITLLWLLLLLFHFLVGIPSTPTCWENGHTQKHRGRAKRRRKGGTPKGSRYYHRKEEESKRLNSILKRPLGQHHDTNCFHQHLCPDPSCEVYNNTIAELSRLPLPEALEDSPPFVFPLASTAPVTQPSLIQSPASSADPPRDLIPLRLPEPLPSAPSLISPNPRTPLGNFLSPSPPGQTLPPEPFPPLESKFPAHHSPPQPKDSFSSNLAQCNGHLEPPALHSTKSGFAGDTAAKRIDPRRFLFLGPDEHDSAQQYSYPKTKEDHLKQKLVQLFWGLPFLHSESLSSALHVLGDCSSIFIFNCISNAFTDHESPVLPYFLPPSLLTVQSQPLPLTQIQPQAHLQPPLPTLPSSPIPQNRACGVQFHGPQNELDCLTSPEIQCLEWNALQKKQESLWGLPSIVQKSREDFCPSAPTSPQQQPREAYVSISVAPVDFPLSSELREKFEHHLRKRLIQHRWGLPRRIHESLSLMKPRKCCKDTCESKSCYGLSWISAYKSQSSQPGSFHEWSPETFQQEKDEGMDEGHSQDSDPKDLLHYSESSADKDMGSDSEKDLAATSWSEENSVVAGPSESSRELGEVLQAHLSKKFEEISEGQLPRTVHGSWHTIEETRSVKSDNEVKQRSLPPSVDGDYCLNTSQELSFLEPGTQQMLEAHITNPRTGMLQDSSSEFLEFREIFKLKDTSSHSSSHRHSSSSANLTSMMNSKSGGSTLLRGSSKSLHGEKVGPENSARVLNSSLSATSLVGEEGQGTLRPSPSDLKHGLIEEIQRIITNSISGKASQTHFPTANIHPPELPARQVGDGHEPENKNVNSSDKAEMQLGRNMEEKAEPASMSNVSRKTVKAEELSAVQYKTSDSLETKKPGVSQRINVNKTIGTTALTTKMTPLKISHPKSSDLKQQLLDELKSTIDNRKNRQTQGQPTDMSHGTNQASLPGAQGVSSVDRGASQVLHVHLGDQTVSVDKPHEPWVPEQTSRLCPDKNFPPALKELSPKDSKPRESGGGDAGLMRSQTGSKRVPTQVGFEQTVGSRSPQTPSQKRQCPPESLFINKMKSFFQRFQPGLISTKQENPQVKGNPRSSAQSRGPVRSTAAFMGMTETREAVSDIGNFPEQRLGPPHSGNTTCPQESPLRVVRFETVQQRTVSQAWVEPVQRPALNPRAPACPQSCRQAAVFAGQSPTTIYTRNEGRHPHKVGTLKDQRLYHQHAQSPPCRGTMIHHPNPTCRPHSAQGPPAAQTTEQGTVFRRPWLFITPKTSP